MGRGGGGGGGHHHSPNDDRSNSMNPNNPASQASVDNRADQLNPEHDAYHSSREGGEVRRDDDYDDGGDYVGESVVIGGISFKPVPPIVKEQRSVERMLPKTGEKAFIKWSSDGNRYILTLSDKDVLMLFGEGDMGTAWSIDAVKKVLTALGYEVHTEWMPI